MVVASLTFGEHPNWTVEKDVHDEMSNGTYIVATYGRPRLGEEETYVRWSALIEDVARTMVVHNEEDVIRGSDNTRPTPVPYRMYEKALKVLGLKEWELVS